MSQASFTVRGNPVGRVRLEATDIIGTGSPANPQLILPLKFQLSPFGPSTCTLLRMSVKIYVGNEHHPVATAEHPPLSEDSMPNASDRPLNLLVPLTLTQIKHIEDIRSGSNLSLRIVLSGLVSLKQMNEFERWEEVSLHVSIPYSHWIETGLNAWGLSDLRLLEIKFPGESRKEMVTARARLDKAEELYRAGDYPHVLSQLRSAFDAVAEAYSQKGPSRETWEKLLTHTHTDVRSRLLGSFTAFRDFLQLGPHEPIPTPQTPVPISQQDARFGLVVAHAIFEYFSSESWPGI
ncbi:MAG TPA: hypothetical protein VGM18_12985 [Candidatus Sulfotelmatobacter sp.]|jgi:hypothetical protein